MVGLNLGRDLTSYGFPFQVLWRWLRGWVFLCDNGCSAAAGWGAIADQGVALPVHYSLGGQFLLCVGGYIATLGWGRGTRVLHCCYNLGWVSTFFFVWSSALNSRVEVEATNKVMRMLQAPCVTSVCNLLARCFLACVRIILRGWLRDLFS